MYIVEATENVHKCTAFSQFLFASFNICLTRNPRVFHPKPWLLQLQMLFFLLLMTFASTMADYCGEHKVPFGVEVHKNGVVNILCSRPNCHEKKYAVRRSWCNHDIIFTRRSVPKEPRPPPAPLTLPGSEEWPNIQTDSSNWCAASMICSLCIPQFSTKRYAFHCIRLWYCLVSSWLSDPGSISKATNRWTEKLWQPSTWSETFSSSKCPTGESSDFSN